MRKFNYLIAFVLLCAGCSSERNTDVLLLCLNDGQSVQEFIESSYEFAANEGLEVRISKQEIDYIIGPPENFRFNLTFYRDGYHLLNASNRALSIKEIAVWFSSMNSDYDFRDAYESSMSLHFEVRRLEEYGGIHAGFCPFE